MVCRSRPHKGSDRADPSQATPMLSNQGDPITGGVAYPRRDDLCVVQRPNQTLCVVQDPAQTLCVVQRPPQATLRCPRPAVDPLNLLYSVMQIR